MNCAICQDDIKETDSIRRLEFCDHEFHENCIDRWLLNNASCPLCRHNCFVYRHLQNLDARYVPLYYNILITNGYCGREELRVANYQDLLDLGILRGHAHLIIGR